jgi:hypothetical protein
MFEGEDMNEDGFLVGNEGSGGLNEITAFNMKFSGNSIVPAFTLDFSDFSNSNSGFLVYELNEGPFLGDSGGEVVAAFGTLGTREEFGILPDSGRTAVFSKGSVTFSSELIKVSAVPLPIAVWLFGSSLLGLIGMRQIKSFY